MSLNNPSDRGQSDSVTGKFGGGVETLERLEKTARAAWIETTSVIGNKINRAAVVALTAEFDASVFVLRSVLPCISQQILHRDAQQAHVAEHLLLRSRDEPPFPAGFSAAQLFDDRTGNFAEVDLLRVHYAGCNARK